MKIVFMGTPDFAVATLEALVKAGHELVLVITQPDKKRGRSGTLQKSDVRVCAEKYEIPVLTPTRLRTDEECQRKIKDLEPDLIVVTAFGQILPKEVLDIPSYGCINVHASLLPRYRGASPIQWAILNGDAYAGVTTMMMNEGLDEGDILEQASIRLSEEETGGSLFEKLALLGGELIVKTIEDLENGTMPRCAQDHTMASKVSTFTRESGHIDWEKPAVQIERMIRGLNPWPSAFTYLNGKQFKIWKAKVEDSILLDEENYTSIPLDRGGVLYTDGISAYASTSDGILELLEVQLEGKRRMETSDFLRGYQWKKR